MVHLALVADVPAGKGYIAEVDIEYLPWLPFKHDDYPWDPVKKRSDRGISVRITLDVNDRMFQPADLVQGPCQLLGSGAKS